MAYEWCRLYNKIINNQVMRGMPGHWFRAWIFLMVLANQAAERGFIYVDDKAGLANLLCVDEDELDSLIEKLDKAGMARWIDSDTIEVINFRELQYDYPSDQPKATAMRKKRARNKKAPSRDDDNVTTMSRECHESVTSEARACHGVQTTEYRVQNSTPLLSPRDQMEFDRFWAAYPSRQRQKRKAAQEAWAHILNTEDGERPNTEHIIEAARNYAKATADKAPRFIQHAANFLDKHTWEDYVSGVPEQDAPANSAPSGRYIPNAEETRRMLREQDEAYIRAGDAGG